MRDPWGKDAQLAEVADWSNAAEIESGVARAPLDAGWKVGEQGGNGLQPVRTLGGTYVLQKRLPLSRYPIWPVEYRFSSFCGRAQSPFSWPYG